MTTMTIEIPQSIQVEHNEIHAALVEATKEPGPVGQAATQLAAVLHPHFVREEEIALPPLGVLAALVANDAIPDAVQSEVLAMTDALKAELPRMLQEHTHIREAVGKLRDAARAEQSPRFEQLAEQLALHARTEEEVLYPAAVLVGEILRARSNNR